MASLGGPQAGLDRCYSTEYFDDAPSEKKINSLKEYLEEFQVLPEQDLPAGASYGIRFLSWSFNCPEYLVLMARYLTDRGVEIKRKRLAHISEAVSLSTAVVFNCSGLGARSLGGVEDKSMYPTRGQVVVVKAPHIHENVMRWGRDYATYIIKRPHSHDQLILGGFMQKDDWSPDTTREQSQNILARTTELYPKILTDNPHGQNVTDLEVLRSAAGLRPSRHGGVRIKKEVMNGVVVVHNHGAGGYGFQAGLGMAVEAVSLASERAKL